MSKITKNNWAMYCGHANEMPYSCPCDDECGCRRWGGCRTRNPSSLIEKDSDLEGRVADLEDKVDRILQALKTV